VAFAKTILENPTSRSVTVTDRSYSKEQFDIAAGARYVKA